MEAFVYTRLPPFRYDTVRLLEVLPEQPAQPLECVMREVQLSDNPIYMALSYCWGDPNVNRALLCNGKTLPITSSLFATLCGLRDPARSIILWVDAVCINQGDIEERNAQVVLMAQIYEKADMVLMWLGEGDFDSKAGLHLVEQLAKAQTQRMAKKDTRNRYQLQWVGLDSYGLPMSDDPGYSSFIRLVRRPWFSRGWVLQEATLAKDITVCCGSFRFQYHDFMLAWLCCAELGMLDDVSAIDMTRLFRVGLMRQAHAKGHKEELLTLLCQTRLSVTSDPRDKIYCLLGLACDSGAMGLDIRPDYNLDFESIYRDLTVKIIQVYSHLDVLCVPKHMESSGLPSWVPDWRAMSAAGMMTLTGREQNSDRVCKYRAAGDSKASVKFAGNRAILGLSGFSVDQIVECGGVETPEESSHETSTVRRIFKAFATGLNVRLQYINWKYVAGVYNREKYITGEDKIDAFWQTLTAGYYFGPVRAFDEKKALYKKWDSHLLTFGSLRRWLPKGIFVALIFLNLCLQGFRTFFALTVFLPLYSTGPGPFTNMMSCVLYRRVVRTFKGYMALAPASTREGDYVVLFEGGRLPLVVRKNEEYWTILGDCYVHGIMNGEAFDKDKCDIMWIE